MKQLEYALLSHKKCQKTLEPSFKRPYALSVCFKMKPLRKSVFPCYGKTNSNYAVKAAKKREKGEITEKVKVDRISRIMIR